MRAKEIITEISRRDFLKGIGATAGLVAIGDVNADERTTALAQDKARAEQLARLRASQKNQQSTHNAEIQQTLYADAVAQKFKPLIMFDPYLVGNYNPAIIIKFRLQPDGTVIDYNILQNSAFDTWDRAVLKAVDKVKIFPKDAQGKVPQQITITFRPKD